MSTDLETYEGQVARLDRDYILAAGEALRARLFPRPSRVRDERTGELVDGPTPYPLPSALAYAPGNGTSYELVFAPVWTLRQVGSEVNENIQLVPEGCFDESGDADDGWVLVSQVGGLSYPFELGFGGSAHYSYVADKLGLNFADGVAVTALFRAIMGTAIA